MTAYESCPIRSEKRLNKLWRTHHLRAILSHSSADPHSRRHVKRKLVELYASSTMGVFGGAQYILLTAHYQCRMQVWRGRGKSDERPDHTHRNVFCRFVVQGSLLRILRIKGGALAGSELLPRGSGDSRRYAARTKRAGAQRVIWRFVDSLGCADMVQASMAGHVYGKPTQFGPEGQTSSTIQPRLCWRPGWIAMPSQPQIARGRISKQISTVWRANVRAASVCWPLHRVCSA